VNQPVAQFVRVPHSVVIAKASLGCHQTFTHSLPFITPALQRFVEQFIGVYDSQCHAFLGLYAA
jgi:hypothetical protein